MEKTYIIGHKSPDLDSVAAAISFSIFKNRFDKTDRFVPAIAGDVNRETAYALEKFGFDKPEALETAEGREVVLVDHNEFSQAVSGIEKARILEVLDHHKVKFDYPEPIEFRVLPWGSTCSIIAQLFFNAAFQPEKELAGLMLSAILVDTVITRSPTCTEHDKRIIEQLADIAEIDNWQDFGLEIFKVRSSVSELNEEEIIKSDFKDFELKAGKFGIGQVETVDLKEFDGRRDALLSKLEEIRTEGGYHSVILFLTDIIKEGSLFLVATADKEKVEQALGAELDNNQAYIDNIISRKKQVAPKFTGVFDN